MDKNSVYSSERLTFRGIGCSDAEDIVRWRSDPANYRNFLNAHALTLEEHLAWFERYLSDTSRFDFMIIDPEGRSIGTAGLSNITDESCEISYMIGDLSARGKGYATETIEAMSRIALDELGVDRVIAQILPHNEGSIRAITKAGYAEAERIFVFRRDDLS